LTLTAKTMRERGSGWMERRSAKTPDQQNRGEHGCRCRQAHQTQHTDGEDGPQCQQEARPPAIREVAEADLRD
jgi:hypothetical protein